MSILPRTAPHTAAALHPAGAMCAHAAPGHDLHPMQRRLASTTPSKWTDAIAHEVSGDGWLELTDLDGTPLARVWHHEHLAELVRPGEPIALHTRYGVLAAAGTWLNVAVG